jgi:putative ABC transport system permease protein
MSELVSSIDSLHHSLALATSNQHGAIEVSFSHLLIAFAVILAECIVAHYLEVGLSDQLFVAGIRAFLQLNILGYILAPIFASDSPCIVLLYIFGFMVLVSAYEAAARPKVTYPGLFFDAVKTTAISLLVTGILMLIIVRPSPWYDAQYLIPIAGMLISNSLSGNALALNGMLDHLSTRKEQVEVLLSFGATKWEAAWPGFTKTFRTALIPAVNGLNVIGLVSIPGMMTGQILGGSAPATAAKYQIVISFLISGSNFLSVLLIMLLTISSLFDSRGRLDTSRITKQRLLNVAQLFTPSIWKARWAAASSQTPKSDPLLDAENVPLPGLQFQVVKHYAGSAPVVLDVNLEATVAKARSVVMKCKLHAKEIAMVMGPSGIGKSTILKTVCDLQDQASGGITLLQAGEREMKACKGTEWRRDVLYLHQSKAPLPDTPRDLIASIAKLKVNSHEKPEAYPFDPRDLSIDAVRRNGGASPLVELMQNLNLREDHLDSEWSQLSGGEAQRVMIAIGLATKPMVLLLDEPTSALDEASKKLVENAVQQADCSVLWVTHDERQAERFGNSIWKLVEV